MQKSALLCSVCLHQWRVPRFALKYLCNPPPPPQGDCHLATPPPFLSVFFFILYHVLACPALWAMGMSRHVDTREVPLAYPLRGEELQQHLAEVESELGEAQVSSYSTPPQSPRPDFSPSTTAGYCISVGVTGSVTSDKKKRVNLSNTRFAVKIYSSFASRR